MKADGSIREILFQHLTEYLHYKNKKIGGERVALSQASSSFKIPTELSIDRNRKPRGGDTVSNKVDKADWKIEAG